LNARDLISIADLSAGDIEEILALAAKLKSDRKAGRDHPLLRGKSLAMIFEKPSLRTRVTFEVGMQQLGGHAVYLAPGDIRMGERESVADVARNLERWVDGIMARTFAHNTVAGLAEYATIPVINGLSDLEHPCQALADFLTIREHKGELQGLKMTFVGDGNNVAHSLVLLAAKVGVDFTLACPEGFEADAGVWELAGRLAADSGASLEVVADPAEGVRNADVVYTDVWVSMGQEEETAKRMEVFRSFQVDRRLLGNAKRDAIVLHCLPAHRGLEIADEVIDGRQSVVLDEAENRLHAQKAALTLLMAG